MGLAHRVIPSILCRGRTQVKGSKFNSWRSVGDVAQAMRVHAGRQVDELVLLDIGATPEGRGPDLALIEELSTVVYCPLAVGGGVTSLSDVKRLLRAGADKVVIGRAAFNNQGLIRQCSDVVGAQAIVVALDVLRDMVVTGDSTVFVGAERAARAVEAKGAGEILLTSMEREGTLEGYDLDLIREVSKAVSIPVIAHGGCGSYTDMLRAIQAGASAVAAGALFQFTESTPREAALFLQRHGIETRIPA